AFVFTMVRKNQIAACAAVVLLIGRCICLAEPPPNDDFANRIVLSGNDITFTGILAGATTEYGSPGGEPEVYWGCGASFPSVWWSWTANETSPVILEAIDSIGDAYQCCMAVWPPPNPQ